MKKKGYLFLSICFVAFVVLTGCSKKPEPQAVAGANGEPAKPATITVWLQKTFSDEFNEAFAQLFTDWGKQNGIRVNTEIIDAAALRDTKLPAAIEAKNYPNVTFMDGSALMNYQSQGLIVPVADTLDTLKANGTNFVESVLKPSTIKGVRYGVPFSTQSWMLWYRKDLLAAAGYSGPPQTWDEMLEMSVKVTNPAKNIYGAGFPTGAQASDFNNMATSALWDYGGAVMKNGKLDIGSTESQEALKMLLRFYERGTVAQELIVGDDMSNNTAMLSGTACFIVNIPTIAGALQTNAPDIWANTGCAPLPAGPKGRFSLVEPNILSVLDYGEGTNYWAKKAVIYAVDKSRLGPILSMIAPAYGMAFADYKEFTEYMANPVAAAHMEAVMGAQPRFYPDAEMTSALGAVSGSMCYLNNIIASVVVDKMSFDAALQKQLKLYDQVLADLK
jgi:multiple sugar transport system substrate-binding protein